MPAARSDFQLRTAALIAAAVAAALLGAACGGSSGGSSSPPPPTVTTNLWVVADDAAALGATPKAAFTTGDLYVNAHTVAHAGGEVRGQLDKAGTVRLATLDGAQETPAVTTTAFGASAIAVDGSTGAVRGFIITSGLTGATAAHIHDGARGAPGGVIVPLTGGPDVWVVPDGQANLTPAQIADFQAGKLYVNVHTPAHGGGEIRGQLDKAGTIRLASLDGAQETPSPGVTTTAFGAGVVSVDEATGDVRGFVISSGVTGTLAHIHPGARGAAGSPLVGLTGGPSLWVVPDQQAALAAADVTAFTGGGLYANVHSAAHPGGEIRGQLSKSGTVRLASMDGAQETPAAITTSAFGAGLVSVDDTSGEVAGFIVTGGLVDPTNAHIHQAARGAGGGVVTGLHGP
ncbi:MAG TPA: CHRD domain-containing protein [Anaeromyxobacteraceae bacterium]|nr:CHRD domain-containing protein [Anaeromyxobacteraceae bacterium]